ncbi:zinc-binding alcohol dehydrogenase [Exiguobacterium sp. Leaf187]|uniref:zinc-binding dehydrogenase n=1 Tax=Exiguobacterium TaxID=33986 RepID=UPI0006FC1417|nr:MULTISPECIES: zinc-binding dehydrogenase [Exiguobacterium]KQS19407.1 zinc-binding alcohol dehydrogenase [Exiguobacterium sp. Leaf187]NTY09988.1 zinc-binding alcohol dehydrogenase [Exiguobacterium sp. JMULE1]
MKAWLNHSGTAIGQWTFEEVETPTPGEGQALIRVKTVALNPVDYKATNNPAWTFPHIPGVDLAGVVEQIGPGAEVKIGDRVAIHTNLQRDGAFAEYALVDTRALALIPEDISFAEAAAILCAGMTAYEAIIQKMNTTGKETILIHAGAGGVGGIGIQLAKRLGLSVATTASTENHEWVKRLGADLAIDYKKENVTDVIRDWTNGRGADLIFNTVGRDEATADLGRLAFSGQLAFIAGGPDQSVVKPFTLSPSIHEVALAAAYASEDDRAIRNLGHMASELLKLVAAKELDPLVTEEIPAADIVKGLQRLSERHVRGKIIATFN